MFYRFISNELLILYYNVCKFYLEKGSNDFSLNFVSYHLGHKKTIGLDHTVQDNSISGSFCSHYDSMHFNGNKGSKNL